MGLVSRFIQRSQSDGLLMALHLSARTLLGINLINLYNAVIFREHKIFTSCDISTPLPTGTTLPHPVGIVIGHEVKVGSNVRIQQNVTLGRRKPDPSEGYPTVGNDVSVGAGAVVLGDINLGRGCTVGANSVVLDDVSANSTVVGVPASNPDS